MSLHQVAMLVNTARSDPTATLRAMDMKAQRRQQGRRLKEARLRFYRSAREAALDNDWPESTYRSHENGTRTMGDDDVARYGKRYGVRPEKIMFGGAGGTSTENEAVQSVNEVDVRGGGGAAGHTESFDAMTAVDGRTFSADEVRSEWGIPKEYLRGELHMQPDGAWIIEVFGDSMYDPSSPGEPGSLFPGDRVIVDTGDIRPTPPGHFVVFDGTGVVIKLVEVVPRSDRIRLSSRNPAYQPYEATADEARIIGRVRGRISAM